MIALCAPRGAGEDRHDGLSQFIVDLEAPGITVRPDPRPRRRAPIQRGRLRGRVRARRMLVGDEGEGWKQVTGELAFERAGPERFLSSHRAAARADPRASGAEPDRARGASPSGRWSRIWRRCARCRSRSPACCRRARTRALEAALVKDLGTAFEQELPEMAHAAARRRADARRRQRFRARCSAISMLHAPSFTLRGGTREILRGIIARGLGLR